LTELPWDDDGWFDEAAAWIAARVEPTGELEILRLRPWSALLRVPTAQGNAWFKESAPALAFESALTELLASRRGDCIPEVLAAEGARLLTADAGPSVREVPERADWEEIVRLYAEVQIELADTVDELLSLGVPDSRPEALGHAVPGDVPLTLIHEEVHDGNVHLRDGRTVFIDWAEASVSHPFAGLTNTLRMAAWRLDWEPGGAQVHRLRDAYLEPWTRFAPMEHLRLIFAEAYALGALARAATWNRVVTPLTGAAREEYAHNASAWREIYAEAIGPDAKLGA
jgi:Phosphotransferase enzyme family